jgi:3-hydroxyacyl-CoA dehydrogenase
MGPFTLTDYVGLDTTLSILEGWVERYPDEPAFQIPDILKQKVSEGKLGRKTGEGFYKWDGDKKS